MSKIFGKEELENLESLKQDLVGPLKRFAAEVSDDTIGDAKRFYAAQARKAKQKAGLAQKKTAEQLAALRREQAEMQKRRKTLLKRSALTLVFLALFSLVVISFALSSHADEPDQLRLGEACLSKIPPDYENAALHFRRAGAAGCAEGYYRLGEMYESGLLVVGNPCTDDLEALGKEKALQYYALSAQGGYEPAQRKRESSFRSISQEEASHLMETDTSCIVLDVRTQEEYDAGHIPGAVCLPVESIAAPPELLPDYNQRILVYCRSGRRSRQAAQKLAALGYTDVSDFGGILDWTGEIAASADDF